MQGSGAYCENDVGGASATGDGDIILRFAPSVKAVVYMKMGFSPNEACKMSLEGMKELYPNVNAAVICLNAKGEYGAAAIGKFCYSVMDVTIKDVKVVCDV